MKEDKMLMCLICFVLGLLFARITMSRNRFTVGGNIIDDIGNFLSKNKPQSQVIPNGALRDPVKGKCSGSNFPYQGKWSEMWDADGISFMCSKDHN